MLMLALFAAAQFDAVRFFSGYTEGIATLKIALRHSHPVRVHGRGRVEPDGTLVLDQTVEQQGKAATTREWRIRETTPGRYAGTLTEAVGGMTGESEGNRLVLRYRMKHGIHITQHLQLAPDGRSSSNRLVATKFGIPVARLDEVIRKTD